MNAPEEVMWWSPEKGFHRAAPPEIYKKWWELSHADYDKAFSLAGYFLHGHVGGEFDELELRSYFGGSEPERHWFFDLLNGNGGLSQWCVADRDGDQFFVSWYLEFLRARALTVLAESARDLPKTLIAFIRHGHGTDTIDVYGRTLEERVQQQEILARYRREKVAREKAAAQKDAAG